MMQNMLPQGLNRMLGEPISPQHAVVEGSLLVRFGDGDSLTLTIPSMLSDKPDKILTHLERYLQENLDIVRKRFEQRSSRQDLTPEPADDAAVDGGGSSDLARAARELSETLKSLEPSMREAHLAALRIKDHSLYELVRPHFPEGSKS